MTLSRPANLGSRTSRHVGVRLLSVQVCAHLQESPRHQPSGAQLRTSPPSEASPQEGLPNVSRRHQLAALAPLLLSTLDADAAQSPSHSRPLDKTGPSLDPSQRSPTPTSPPRLSLPDYSKPGPLQPVRLPQLEHTCTTCAAPADRCRLKIRAWAPKGGGRLGLSPPYPLAVITPGFLISADQYTSYAERLASWGWVVVTYDHIQQALDPISDLVCVSFLRDLLDWCRAESSAPLGSLCDTSSVYLIGHSRGGKISALAAAEDSRVQALFLLDPVDVTVYAPLSTEYPSAVAALSSLATTGRSLPVAVVGSGRGGDCVPRESNYQKFYDATRQAPAWLAVVQDAGHLQFLDGRAGNAMDLVCAAGKVSDAAVSGLAGAMMVAWGETMVRRRAGVSTSGKEEKEESLRMGVDSEGNLVAGLASFDAMQVLFATEADAKKAIAVKQGIDIAVSTRAKNFEL